VSLRHRGQRIIILPNAGHGMAKVNKQTQQLFLRLLNFSPELLEKTQQEAKFHNTSFDAIVRAAVEYYLKDQMIVREQRQQEAELKYARSRLRAHFAEDRNEFLTEDDIRIIGGGTPPPIGNTKPQ
jgi:hypothetical protein